MQGNAGPSRHVLNSAPNWRTGAVLQHCCCRGTGAALQRRCCYRGTDATLQGQASHRAPVSHGSHPLRPVNGAAVLRVQLRHKRVAWKVGWLVCCAHWAGGGESVS